MSLNEDFRTQTAAGQAPLADLIEAGSAPSPLDSAEAAFRLLGTGPDPLAIDGGSIGLAQGSIRLGELNAHLRPETAIEVRDAAWRLLIERARQCGPDWKLACVGMALPGLRNLARALSNGRPSEDLDAEILTRFLEKIAVFNLSRSRIAHNVCTEIRDEILRARKKAPDTIATEPEAITQMAAVQRSGHPDLLLAQAVHQEIITGDDADLIGTTRLDGVPLSVLARKRGISYRRAIRQRQQAEQALAAAIRDGRVSAKSS